MVSFLRAQGGKGMAAGKGRCPAVALEVRTWNVSVWVRKLIIWDSTDRDSGPGGQSAM